ncbi:hypothetical protein NW762_012856 [Fusarium torreyae]|uniref:Uncharacterized protein n=1 Tax=Fusarium torreyae TaxID=1237075 RepID=A0A9W8RLM2_9HYPO|nr:hypothetical protein NW762_012856 [Fusarium torreyae]
MLPKTPDFALVSANAQESQHLFGGFGSSSNIKNSLFSTPKDSAAPPCGFLSSNFTSASPELKKSPAKLPFSFASCVAAMRDYSSCICSDPNPFMPILGELVRFVYDRCTIDGDSLRHVLAQFAACMFEDVRYLGGWHELITEVPSFAVDTFRKLTDRCALLNRYACAAMVHLPPWSR